MSSLQCNCFRRILAFGVASLFLFELRIMGRISVPVPHRLDGRNLSFNNDDAGLEKAVEDSTLLKQAVSPNNPPRKLTLGKQNVLVLHIGKSAGGTLIHRVRQQWRLFVEQCHPSPCSAMIREPPKQERDLMITLRDPVDRFVSAFYWRAYMVCHPIKAKRLWATPPRGCHGKWAKDEAKTIYLKYDMNASLLAQDLCSSDPIVRANATTALQTIQHAKWNITNFLNFDWQQDPAHLFPLVVERGMNDSFEDQTDAAVHWLYKRRHFESEQAFADRQRHLAQINKTNDKEHSSSALKQDLTPRAEQCLVQFYRQDYELLDELRKLACKTKACRQGIASILARRAPLLQQSTAQQ